MRAQKIWSSHNNKAGEYPLVDGLASLLWMAQLGTLEIHPWYSRAAGGRDVEGISLDTWSNDDALDESVLDYPDFLVVDLDPHVPDGKENDIAALKAAFQSTVPVAIKFKETLDSLKLDVYLKTSGKSGLHIFVPIERNLHYPAVRLLCETFGRHLMAQTPEHVTMEWSVSKRPAKVFFDHNQNVRGKTLVGIYSPRAAQSGAAAFPITWDELETVDPASFKLENIPDLLAERGDLWSDILEHKHDLRSMVAK